MNKHNSRRLPSIWQLIIALLVIIGAIILLSQINSCMHVFQPSEKHMPASVSEYEVRTYSNELHLVRTWSTDGKSTYCGLTNKDFKRHVLWHIEGTNYLGVIFRSKRCNDGTGDECFYEAVVYYPRKK